MLSEPHVPSANGIAVGETQSKRESIMFIVDCSAGGRQNDHGLPRGNVQPGCTLRLHSPDDLRGSILQVDVFVKESRG